MDQIKNNNPNNSSASSTIQSAIDELTAFPTSSTTTNTNTNNTTNNNNTSTSTHTSTSTTSTSITTNHTNNTSTHNTLSSIDSTLNALDQQFPFSNDGRSRPHPSTLSGNNTSNTNSKQNELARSLGSFGSSALANPLGIHQANPYNPLGHWGTLSRNPYASPYGASRNATKSSTNSKDINNPRKKSYEDKMDKQRLEHILFSGDNQNDPKNKQKERMRKKLQKNKCGSKKNNKKHKKTQSLPNGSNNAHLSLDSAKKQKANGDNGFYLTEMNTKSSKSNDKNNTNVKKKNSGNQKKRGNQRLQHKKGGKKKNNIKKGQKKKKQPQKKKDRKHQNNNDNNNKKDNNNINIDNNNVDNNSNTNNKNTNPLDKIDKLTKKLDSVNEAYGEQSVNNNNYVSSDILNKQDSIFEATMSNFDNDMPDEYFKQHDITPLMQNKLKLELNQQIPGISLWKDKRELEPLLNNNNNNNNNYHTNKNPHLLSPNTHIHITDDNFDDEDDDPFVDNFDDVNDSDNYNEGDNIKNKPPNHSNFSSNSNDSDAAIIDGDNDNDNDNDSNPIEIYIDPNEREVIRKEELNNNNNNEPGSLYNNNNKQEDDETYQFEGINSNVDLIKAQEALIKDKQRRNSVIENSMTTHVNGGFEVDADEEEKQIQMKATDADNKMVEFNAQGVERPNEVQYVNEEEEDDLFANMDINEPDNSQKLEKENDNDNDNDNDMKEDNNNDEGDQEKGEQLGLALNKVLNKMADMKKDNNIEEQREKEAEDEMVQVKSNNNVGDKWKDISNLIKHDNNKGNDNEGIKHDKKDNKKDKKNDRKNKKNNKKKNSNDKKDNKKNKQIVKGEKKKKNNKKKQDNKRQQPKEERIRIDIEDENTSSKQNNNNNNNNNNNSKGNKNKKNDKKKKKRAKKKRAKKNKEKQKEDNAQEIEENNAPNAPNASDDDTITIDSSSNAPSSLQYEDNDDAADGWITKGTKNNKKNQKRNNKNVKSPTGGNNNVSTPVSDKSSTFQYNDVNDKKKGKKKHKEKPQVKKAKSVNNMGNKQVKDRVKNRKERRANNRVNRQKSDSVLLNNHKQNHNHKFASNTISISAKHSRKIEPSMILPKNCQLAISEPLTKNNPSYPPLKQHGKKTVHFADTNMINNKRLKGNKNISVNLNVLSPRDRNNNTPKNGSSTPDTITRDRPRKPPITRLQRGNKDHNVTPPVGDPILNTSQSEQFPNINDGNGKMKPPLLSQKSAPLISTNNKEISTQTSNNNDEKDTQNNQKEDDNIHKVVTQPSLPPLPPNNNTAETFIASTNGNATHMALYLDESGNLHETPLTLPDIFPNGLPPTSIPNGLGPNIQLPNVLGPLGGLPLPTTTPTGDGDNASPDNINNNTLGGLSLPLTLGGPQPPNALGLNNTFLSNLPSLPTLPNVAPLPGVPPLNTIPHTIPILLPLNPMPQFTAAQMAKLNSNLNLNNNINTNTNNTNTNTTKKSVLQPSVPLFKPSKSKMKLEDIKEEDEHEHIDSIQNDNHIHKQQEEEINNNNNNNNKSEEENRDNRIEEDEQKEENIIDANNKEENNSNNKSRSDDVKKPLIARNIAPSDKECLEQFKNDLNKEETEDEWVEIPDLDSTIYPATLWCLNVKSFQAHPQCSLKKLQQSMASALLSS